MKPKVNPRLTKKLKQRRRERANLLAFQRCTAGLEGFDRETQRVALRAAWAIFG